MNAFLFSTQVNEATDLMEIHIGMYCVIHCLIPGIHLAAILNTQFGSSYLNSIKCTPLEKGSLRLMTH